ncbi:MAG: hypothetical protein QM731_11785 [Chitinophagaceae bacterium]
MLHNKQMTGKNKLPVSIASANHITGNKAFAGRPAVAPSFPVPVIQRSKFLEGAIGKAEKAGPGKDAYTRRDVLEYLFKEIDPDKQNQAINDWNAENNSAQLSLDLIIPTKFDVYHDPGAEFLPPNYHKKVKGQTTEERWAEEPFDPSSQSAAFYHSEKNKTAVREHLKEEEEQRGRTEVSAFVKSPVHKGNLFPCNSCLMPTDDTKLQVDHAQAASDILTRQQLMIKHINEDKDYRDAVLKHFKDAEKYFLNENEGTPSPANYVGSKLFFQRYYNHLDNLWFLCADCNGLTGKSGKETIEWLRGIKWFGDAFVKSLGIVNDRGLLIRAQDGKTLAAKALEWAIKHGSKELESEMVFKKHHEHFQQDIRERTLLSVEQEHGATATHKKAAIQKGDELDIRLDAHMAVLKKVPTASVEGLKAAVNKMDKIELRERPQFKEGHTATSKTPNPYPIGTPTRRNEAFTEGQKQREKEDEKIIVTEIRKEIPELKKSLEEKEKEIGELKAKNTHLESENSKLRHQVAEHEESIVLLKKKLEVLDKGDKKQSDSPTISITGHNPQTISAAITSSVVDKSGKRKEIEEAISEIMNRKLGKVSTLQVLRDGYLNKALAGNTKWEGTQKKKNAIVASILLYLKEIKKPEDIVYAGKGLEEVGDYDAKDFLPQ